jgi:hypothetical protein
VDVPPAPNRRLVLAVRLILYPAAILLIALWWHGHRAKASAEGPDLGTALTGSTSQHAAASGRIRDGAPRSFDIPIHYACPAGWPGLAHFVLRDLHTVRPGDQIDRNRVATSVDGARIIYANGWTGVYGVWTDGTFDQRSWRGTLRSTMALRYRDGPRAVCYSGPVRFVLRQP